LSTRMMFSPSAMMTPPIIEPLRRMLDLPSMLYRD
jgi:hypothetical protein